MRLRTIRTTLPHRKRVFIRVDFNVPLKKRGNGYVVDEDLRIRRSFPTIRRLLGAGNSLVLAAHLGRPKGKPDPKFSLAPVGRHLQRLFKRPVVFVPDCIGPGVAKALDSLPRRSIALLENLRFHPEEKKNGARFARALASLADVYVNDAFGNAHRSHASVVAITRYLPSFAGLLLEEEVRTLTDIMEHPKRPFVGIVGGAKIGDKLGTIQHLIAKVDALLLGGALANTVLQAKGIQVGRSRIDVEGLGHLKRIRLTDRRIHIPLDVVVSYGQKQFSRIERSPVGRIPPRSYIYDIGPDTVDLYCTIIRSAGTILWAGPMGYFEEPVFRTGTDAIARAVAASRARTVIGGGDTTNAVHDAGVLNKMSFVSTGGGAMLAFLSGETLPALRPLIYH